MNRLITITIFVLTFNHVVYSQTHFCKARKINYKKILLDIGIDEKDSTCTAKLDLLAYKGMEGLKVTLAERKSLDSSVLSIYRNNILIKSVELPVRLWTIDDTVRVADIDGNGLYDLKFLIYNSGSGLGGSLLTKIYLFRFQNEVRVISFYDFSYEDESDLNSDGIFEILSLNHVFKDNHSYWVYNAFNFIGMVLKNVSKEFKYPLWTRHLYRTDRVIAKEITYSDRLKEYREQPDEFVIQ